MPIFEYICQECGQEFEEIVLGSESVVCPACGSADTEKLISRAVFRTGGPIVKGSASANAITSRGKSGCAGCSGGNCSTCN